MENALTPDPQLHTANTVRSMYTSSKHSGQLSRLSPALFSSLISFFGTLSIDPQAVDKISSSRRETPFRPFIIHPLASRIEQRRTKPYWSFVLALADDKASFGYALNDTDHLWLVLASLQEVGGFVDGMEDTDRQREILWRARSHYKQIDDKTAYWSFQYFYLRSIYASVDLNGVSNVVTQLAGLLRIHGWLHGDLVALLWTIMSRSNHLISKDSRTKLVATLRRQVNRFHPHSSPEVPRENGDRFTATNDSSVIRDAFVQSLFSRHRPAVNQDLHDWISWETRKALHAHSHDGDINAHIEPAWNNLTLLSLSFRTNLDGSVGGSPKSRTTTAIDWTLICALSALEDIYCHSPRHRAAVTEEHIHKLQTMIRSLWVMWRNDGGQLVRPPEIICAGVITFLRLTTLIRDEPLKDAIIQHISRDVVERSFLGDARFNQQTLQPLAVEYAITSTMWGLRTWDQIFDSLSAIALIPYAPSEATMKTISQLVVTGLVQSNVTLAYGLSQSAHAFGVQLEEVTIMKLVQGFASSGRVDLAVLYLYDATFSVDMLRKSLDNIMRELLSSRRQYILPSVSRRLGELLLRLTGSPVLPSYSRAFEWTLLAICRSGYAAVASELTLNGLKGTAVYFQSSFLESFVTLLSKQRRYNLLTKLAGAVGQDHPQYSTIHQAAIRSLAFTQASSRISQLDSRSVPFDTSLMHRFIREKRPPSATHSRIIALQLTRYLSYHSKLDTQSLERALNVFVRARRMKVAVRLAKTYRDGPLSTKAGNTILLGSLIPRRRRRHGRQIDHLYQRLRDLMVNDGFVPDRVTINILVKARLRWEPDVHVLRVLFDRLIWSGYPNILSGGGSQQQLPFGTEPTTFHRRDLFTPHYSSSMSLERHIRPLYRMFIQAFYIRGDKEAAGIVTDILTSIRNQVLEERARRARGRRQGRLDDARQFMASHGRKRRMRELSVVDSTNEMGSK
ncbi:hypothetical protein BD410DRAFT_784707 [Rickenella mellea]|uniref:Uncharacterized protein n=1 Tax=Rickenella mellea TaxID=50990 RepID=A0A4Y7QEP0_9AGAM|nr:hypothetical protein BD410DRAFT_784707 [Rickenella mellea]